ncbi:helix-turn-helix transcriptional regulator [Streptomyces sp. NPDC046977]|uniref:response regulator transcription factor n=1 Tax=Streptomyces sp. NPDC046977 TaxID=3154703 RepID=UPI0033FC79A8
MSTDFTRLTPAERRVAEQLVLGLSNAEIAAELGISPGTVAGHLGSIGRRFHLSARPTRAHAVLGGGQIDPPPAPGPAPELTTAETMLLQAIAAHEETHEIARAADIADASVGPHVRDLVEKTGAKNPTHLVGLGHAWKLFTHVSEDRGAKAVLGAVR